MTLSTVLEISTLRIKIPETYEDAEGIPQVKTHPNPAIRVLSAGIKRLRTTDHDVSSEEESTTGVKARLHTSPIIFSDAKKRRIAPQAISPNNMVLRTAGGATIEAGHLGPSSLTAEAVDILSLLSRAAEQLDSLTQ